MTLLPIISPCFAVSLFLLFYLSEAPRGVKYLLCVKYGTANLFVKTQLEFGFKIYLHQNEKMIRLEVIPSREKNASLGDLAARRIKNAAFHPQAHNLQPALRFSVNFDLDNNELNHHQKLRAKGG